MSMFSGMRTSVLSMEDTVQHTFVLPRDVTDRVCTTRKADGQKYLVTHNGRFHCDDVLAIGILMLLPEHKDAIVVRTRDEEHIKNGDIVVDVGGVYDPASLRFDHHQKGFSEYFDPTDTVTVMSSVGQIYKHFGRRLLLEVFTFPQDCVDLVYNFIYVYFIKAIDAIDNGVNITPPGVEPLYIVTTDLSSRIANINKNWLTWDPSDEVNKDDFLQAIPVAMKDFLNCVCYYRNSWLPSREIVKMALINRYDIHTSGHIMLLSRGCPYEVQLSLFEEEEEKKSKERQNNTDAQNTTTIAPLVYFVIYPSDNSNKKWRLKTVRTGPNTFESRLMLPERYRGLRDQDIDFPGINFVHHKGFLAGASSKEAAIAFANLTLCEGGIITC